MKVVLIGASGLIGQAVAQALSAHHEIVRVGYSKGDSQVDLASKDSLQRSGEIIDPRSLTS